MKKSSRELRTFGFAFGGGLAVLSALLFWKGRPAAPYLATAVAVIWLLALAAPKALTPLEKLLAGIFRVVTTVLTYVVLTIIFFLVLTPIGLAKRLFGTDGLGKKPDPSRASYWVDVAPDGPGSRPNKPF